MIFSSVNFMKVIVKKVLSSSTFPKTIIIASSISLKITNILIFKNLGMGHPPPHANGRVTISWGQHGRIAIGLHNGNKK